MRYQFGVLSTPHTMPTITLPDGTQKQFDHPVTTQQVAESIGPGLAKATIAGRIDGVLADACVEILIHDFMYDVNKQ